MVALGRSCFSSLVFLSAAAGPLDIFTGIQEPVLFLADPSASRVTFTLEATAHTVEGTLAVRSGSVSFDPKSGAASGEIVVDLTSGETGNNRRDRKMHDDVLESATYPTTVFRPNRVTGTVPSEGSAEVKVEGVLSLHGSDHTVTLPARVTVDGRNISIGSAFQVPYVEWGLEDPSFFVLRVAKQVAVRVELTGALSASPRSSKP